MKTVLKLTEQDLHNLIKESVKKALNEIGDTEKGQFALGAVRGRAQQRAHKEYASDKPNYDKADKYDATARYAGGTAQDEYDKAVQSGKDSQEGLEKGSKMRNAFQKGREYGKKSIKEGVHDSSEIQSMVLEAIESLDEAMRDCERGNCKAAMFNLPHVKQVLKYLLATL